MWEHLSKNSMPKVSVIITTYNRPQMLDQAIKSVLEQEYTDWECLIMDDNSDSPEQLEVLTKYWNAPGVIIYKSNVKKEDRKATARYATLINKALDMAQGEYITYLCDDDYYYPDRLSKMVKFFEEHPEASVVYGHQRVVKIENGIETATSTRAPDPKYAFENANCLVDHSSVMHRKSASDAVGKWDDSQDWWGGADGQYWEKLGKAGFNFHEIPVVLDAHIIHDGSWTREAKWKYLGTEDEGKSALDTMPRINIGEAKS